MKDLDKVNSSRLISLWKTLALGLLVLVAAMIVSQILSYRYSPIVSLLSAAVLYTMLYKDKINHEASCMVVVYGLFYSTVSFSIISILMNVVYIWGLIELPREFEFISIPYIPTLILDPICAITFLIMYARKNKMRLCQDCKFRNGMSIERGRFGEILHYESNVQITNLLILFSLLSIILWLYYFTLYDHSTGINERDAYVFFTLNVVFIVIDELYFAARYYNLYLDLKDKGDIITEAELHDMTTKTYLRFYVICGNSLYVNSKTMDPQMSFRQIIDTPFITKRNVNGITTAEVNDIIHRMTRKEGELRFFYGRKNPDLEKHSLLRYFYFIDGNPEECPELNVDGEWMDFTRIKTIYRQSPTLMSKTMLSDLSRMTTIVLTQKLFDDRGVRKVKVRSYRPNYDLNEIRENHYDFQDDKWIRIAMFNSDSRGFHVRRLFQKLTGGEKKSSQWNRNQ